jgi:hypothetical protein
MSTPEKQVTRRRRVRHAYVVLALLSLLAGGGSGAYSAHQTSADNANWHQALTQDDAHWRQALTQQQRDLCGVIAPFAGLPVVRPKNPSQHAAAEQYAVHQRFVILSRQFHC